jgi:hypothetical protein
MARILTSTNIQDFLTCPKYFYWNQVRGAFKKGININMSVGTLFHSAMEIWAKEGQEGAIGFLRTAVQHTFRECRDDPAFNPDELTKIDAILLGMVSHYPFPVLADQAEVEFRVPFLDFELAGKWDGEHCYDGRKVIFDYKTKKRMPSHIDDFSLNKRDFQGQFYFYTARLLLRHDEYEGFEKIYVKQPELRQGKKETLHEFCRRIQQDYAQRTDDYYKRVPIFFDPEDGEFIHQLTLILKQIKQRLADNVFEMNYTNCKTKYHKHCVYLPACNQEIGWEDLYDWRGPDHHPELSFGKEELENGDGD